MTSSPTTNSAAMAMKSRRCSRIARFMGTAVRSDGPAAPAGPLTSGTGFFLQGKSIRNGGRAPGSTGWTPSGTSIRFEKLSALPGVPPGTVPSTRVGPPPDWNRA